MPEPTLPTADDIAKLPRWARVAFAARCARRALPLFIESRPAASPEHLEVVRRAVEAAERSAGTATPHCAGLGDDAYAVAVTLAGDAATAARAAGAAVYASYVAGAADDAAYATRAVQAADHRSTVAAIAEDYQLISRAAVRERWTDDTPVPPTVFALETESNIRAVLQKRLEEVEAETPVDEGARKALLMWQERLPEIEAVATPRALHEVRKGEDLAMQKQYPGEYVAYTESQSTAQRTILAHDPDIKAVHDALAQLTEAEWAEVTVAYCYPLDRPFRGGYNRPKLVARTGAEPPAGT